MERGAGSRQRPICRRTTDKRRNYFIEARRYIYIVRARKDTHPVRRIPPLVFSTSGREGANGMRRRAAIFAVRTPQRHVVEKIVPENRPCGGGVLSCSLYGTHRVSCGGSLQPKAEMLPGIIRITCKERPVLLGASRALSAFAPFGPALPLWGRNTSN